MRNLAWTPVLLALALTGCPDKDTGETDPDTGTDTEGTDPDTDTDSDSDTEADTTPPEPQAGDVVYFEGFETDGTAFPDGWTTTNAEGALTEVSWKLCVTGEDCDGNSGANLRQAEGNYYAGIDADGDGSTPPEGEVYQGTLTSGDIDLSEYGDFSIVMTLDQWYRDIGNAFSPSLDSASIEVSSDGGTTWAIVQDFPTDDVDTDRNNNSSSNGPCPSVYDMSAYAGETIQLRFNYTAEWDWWYLVDNIEMTLADAAPTLPEPDAWTCPVEVCDDGIDNDLDGFDDCFDGDCSEDALCDAVCVAETMTLPASDIAVMPDDFTSNLDWSAGTDCTAASGPEIVVAVNAEAGDVIVANEINGDFAAVIRIVDSCSAGTATCLDNATFGSTASYTATEAGTYYVVIEATSATETDDAMYTIGLNPADAEDCATPGDEDLDGDADCADSECSDEPACQEVCDSGLDEDVDGLIDCDDLDDCFNTVECPYECPADEAVVFTDGVFTASGTFADLEALPYDDGDGCGSAFGTGQIWQVSLEANQQVLFEETGSIDTVVRVLDGCVPGDACLESSDTPETIRYRAGDAPETVYFVMEAYFSSATGDWGVTATLLDNEDCATDVDEDLDGDIACDDSDCAMDEACFELDCADGVSGDDDDLVDCMDPDCDDSVDCVEIICDDGIDNDMDGDIDCADSQCLGTPSCPEIACDDGLDNDLDLAIDCDDSDCEDELICYECPAAETSLPLTVSGTTFTDDNPELFEYEEVNGCEGGSNFPNSGTDLLYAVDATAGDIISVTEVSGGVDFIVNITADGCTPADTENECVYGADLNGSTETFVYAAEETTTYYVHVSSYSAVDNDPYEFILDVVPPEQCDTTEDEDGDGNVSCDDSDCFDDFDNCPFECPDLTPASAFPIQLVGDAWGDENRDAVDFTSGDGCISGGGGDYIVAVDMQVGDTISTVENSGGVDFITNVTLGDCLPDAVANTCLYSQDDGPDGGYSYTAETNGIHYMQISSFSNTENDDYDMTINFTPAP